MTRQSTIIEQYTLEVERLQQKIETWEEELYNFNGTRNIIVNKNTDNISNDNSDQENDDDTTTSSTTSPTTSPPSSPSSTTITKREKKQRQRDQDDAQPQPQPQQRTTSTTTTTTIVPLSSERRQHLKSNIAQTKQQIAEIQSKIRSLRLQSLKTTALSLLFTIVIMLVLHHYRFIDLNQLWSQVTGGGGGGDSDNKIVIIVVVVVHKRTSFGR